jgi:hypothetical protein
LTDRCFLAYAISGEAKQHTCVVDMLAITRVPDVAEADADRRRNDRAGERKQCQQNRLVRHGRLESRLVLVEGGIVLLRVIGTCKIANDEKTWDLLRILWKTFPSAGEI